MGMPVSMYLSPYFVWTHNTTPLHTAAAAHLRRRTARKHKLTTPSNPTPKQSPHTHLAKTSLFILYQKSPPH